MYRQLVLLNRTVVDSASPTLGAIGFSCAASGHVSIVTRMKKFSHVSRRSKANYFCLSHARKKTSGTQGMPHLIHVMIII